MSKSKTNKWVADNGLNENISYILVNNGMYQSPENKAQSLMMFYPTLNFCTFFENFWEKRNMYTEIFVVLPRKIFLVQSQPQVLNK